MKEKEIENNPVLLEADDLAEKGNKASCHTHGNKIERV